ncbi:MAG: hypothetical protein ABIF40_00980 [archaeon]
MKKKIIITATVAIIIIVFLTFTFFNKQAPQEYENFAKCLTTNGMSMGGAIWCSHCNSQKNMFGNAFEYIDYHECTIDNWCEEKNIQGYPTWIDKDNNLYPGEQDFNNLAEISGCTEP